MNGKVSVKRKIRVSGEIRVNGKVKVNEQVVTGGAFEGYVT